MLRDSIEELLRGATPKCDRSREEASWLATSSLAMRITGAVRWILVITTTSGLTCTLSINYRIRLERLSQFPHKSIIAEFFYSSDLLHLYFLHVPYHKLPYMLPHKLSNMIIIIISSSILYSKICAGVATSTSVATSGGAVAVSSIDFLSKDEERRNEVGWYIKYNKVPILPSLDHQYSSSKLALR
ncbi:hypothetical protein ACJX0J_026176 [Zea mays]